jgi:hypothetical protein
MILSGFARRAFDLPAQIHRDFHRNAARAADATPTPKRHNAATIFSTGDTNVSTTPYQRIDDTIVQ